MGGVLVVQSTTEIGGAEIVLLDLLKHSRALRGARMVSLGYGQGPLMDRVRALGVPVTEVEGGGLRRPLAAARALAEIVVQARQMEARVILAHGSHPWVFAGLAARATKCRTVFLVNDIYKVPASANNANDAIAALMRADVVLANSEASRQALHAIWKGKREAVLLYPGVDLDRYRPDGSAPRLRAEMGAAADDEVVTIAGRLQQWKGQEVFLRAAAEVVQVRQRARFWIAGAALFGMERAFEERLRALAADLGIAGRVAFLGHRDDMPRIYSASDVVVHASVHPEPFGLVVVEGMAMGRPVVASNLGGPRETVQDGVNGLLSPPGDARALAERIVRLLADPALRERLGAEGRRTVEEHFSATAMARTFDAAVEPLL